MAKGDAGDARKQIQTSRQQYTPQLQSFTNSLYPQQQSNWQNFNAAGALGLSDYNDLMGAYKGFLSKGSPVGYSRTPEMQSAMTGYQDFANTGGFTPQNINDLRERGVSPIRSVYQNAMNDLARNRNLQGGYSPNYVAATEAMTRRLPGQIADATQAVNANLAQMVQQGRLSGLQGLGGLASQDSSLALQAAMASAQNRLQGLGGATSLYGSAPGLAKMYGGFTGDNNSEIARSLGLTTGYDTDMNRLMSGLASAPSDFDIGLGRVGNIGKIGAGIAGMFGGGSR